MIQQLKQFKQQFKNGRLAQSFLVSGPEKTGKFSATIAMTGILNNLNDEQMTLVRNGQMTDHILIRIEEDKKNGEGRLKKVISKKEIDEAMKNVNLKNFQLDKKVIIIKEADKMTNTATNSLLKLIEEPSSNLVIFLLVNNEEDILATIRSRCQNIRFSFLNDNQVKDVIQEEYSVTQEKLQNIVDLSNGRIELAREYAKDTKKIETAQKVRDDFRKALRAGKIEQIKLVDQLTKDTEIDLLWIINEWIWYLKFFLEESIKQQKAITIINKVHIILRKLLETRELIKTTNVNNKVQLENFFVQI